MINFNRIASIGLCFLLLSASTCTWFDDENDQVTEEFSQSLQTGIETGQQVMAATCNAIAAAADLSAIIAPLIPQMGAIAAGTQAANMVCEGLAVAFADSGGAIAGNSLTVEIDGNAVEVFLLR
ncbi:hypothetical protein [Pontivivens nitratireducens]|uniref:hypothetical protein n=1 Tax=Pontivivens nitratireducens TaxID=2758038 RepID=UPI00163A8456|nr:hypothetical protein [Pontibrevibacter nitratireducens]